MLTHSAASSDKKWRARSWTSRLGWWTCHRHRGSAMRRSPSPRCCLPDFGHGAAGASDDAQDRRVSAGSGGGNLGRRLHYVDPLVCTFLNLSITCAAGAGERLPFYGTNRHPECAHLSRSVFTERSSRRRPAKRGLALFLLAHRLCRCARDLCVAQGPKDIKGRCRCFGGLCHRLERRNSRVCRVWADRADHRRRRPSAATFSRWNTFFSDRSPCFLIHAPGLRLCVFSQCGRGNDRCSTIG